MVFDDIPLFLEYVHLSCCDWISIPSFLLVIYPIVYVFHTYKFIKHQYHRDNPSCLLAISISTSICLFLGMPVG